MGFRRRSRPARPCNVLQGEEQLAPSKSVKLATLLPQAVAQPRGLLPQCNGGGKTPTPPENFRKNPGSLGIL